MKKRFWAIFLSLIVVMTCVSIPAYAAEDNGSSRTIVNPGTGTTIPTSMTVHYGQSEPFVKDCHIRNNHTLGTVTTENHNSIHRIIFDIRYCLSTYDTGIGNIKLTLRVTRNSDGAVVYQDTRVGNYGNGAQFKDEFSASPNQTYTMWVDVSSVDPASSNGNYRTAWIQSFYVYTD